MVGWEKFVLQKAADKALDVTINTLIENIKEINNKLNLIINQSLYTALDYLDESLRYNDDKQRKTQALLKACDYFRESYGLKDLWIQVNASFGLSVCYLLLGDYKEWKFRFPQCIHCCNELLQQLIDHAFIHPFAHQWLALYKIEYGDDDYNRLYSLAIETSRKNFLKRMMIDWCHSNAKNYNTDMKTKPAYKYWASKRYIDWKIKCNTCKNIIDAYNEMKYTDFSVM